ncbi:MAG: FAD-dependent oxidoreductase [Pseudomonadales bacterium]
MLPNRCNVFWDSSRDVIAYLGEENSLWNNWFDLSELTREPILVSLNTGSEAEELELLSDQDTIASAMVVLRRMYGEDIPEPVDSMITRWGQDEFTRGSYSYIRVGSTPNMRSDLATSINDLVFFAGEATARDFPESVHGAYLSGLREARSIDGQL